MTRLSPAGKAAWKTPGPGYNELAAAVVELCKDTVHDLWRDAAVGTRAHDVISAAFDKLTVVPPDTISDARLTELVMWYESADRPEMASVLRELQRRREADR